MKDLKLFSGNANPELSERIVFITGGAMEATQRAFLERVPAPVLPKPLDVPRLVGLLGFLAIRLGHMGDF